MIRAYGHGLLIAMGASRLWILLSANQDVHATANIERNLLQTVGLQFKLPSALKQAAIRYHLVVQRILGRRCNQHQDHEEAQEANHHPGACGERCRLGDTLGCESRSELDRQLQFLDSLDS